MNNKDLTKISKQLSYILRHNPDSANLHLDQAGWAMTDELLSAANLTMEVLESVVTTNDKKRFEFSKDKTQIRASQGHSIEVELEYEPKQPPDVLYHGTTTAFLNGIISDGIKKMKRHHVHLSDNITTAMTVGARKGKPVVLEVDTKQMHDGGRVFYLSTNGVWLTAFVPATMIKEIKHGL